MKAAIADVNRKPRFNEERNSVAEQLRMRYLHNGKEIPMRRLPAFLIAILFVFPMFLAALCTVAVSTWALDRGFYGSLLSDQRLYEIPATTNLSGWTGMTVTGGTTISGNISPKAAREILTPDYMHTQAMSVLNQTFDILEDTSTAGDISVDLKPVKAALLSAAGVRFARVVASTLPVSGASASFVMTARSLPASRPSSLSVDAAAAAIQKGLPEFARSLPDTLRLSDTMDFRPPFYARGGRPHVSAVGIMVAADIVLLLLAFGFWMAAGFTGGATLYGRLQWWGWSLFAPALLVFLIGLLTIVSAGVSWVPWGIRTAHLETQGFSAGFIAAVIEAARHAIARVGVGFLATGAIAGGVCFGLLGWSWSLPIEDRNAKKAGG